MVLDMHVLDRHFGDTHVPPTVPAPGGVPGMDALETCVRSMDAPDDQTTTVIPSGARNLERTGGPSLGSG